MSPETIIEAICARHAGTVATASWGETALFHNPGTRLPRGVYFATVKEKDGANDRASKLDREGVFRLSIGIGPEAYALRFGPPPARPAKGGVIAGRWDFSARDRLLPHPVYGWMGWVCVLNPSAAHFRDLMDLVDTAQARAARAFERRLRPPQARGAKGKRRATGG